MLLKLRNTTKMGRSLVPALFLSLSSRSFSLAALKASTRSASLPATLTRCSSLWTLSASWSTSNSRDDWIRRNRACVCERMLAKLFVSSTKKPLIWPSSGSSRSKSGSVIVSASFSCGVNRGGCSGGGLRIASHAFFSSCSLRSELVYIPRRTK